MPTLTGADGVDFDWMKEALILARRAESMGEVPVGALLVIDGERVGEGSNCPISHCDPTAHAEIQALRQAGQARGNYRLPGATLYVTLEPCVMCVGAIIHARVERLVFAAYEPRAGAVVSQLQLLEKQHFNHQLDWVGGVLQEESSLLLRQFFRQRRKK